MPYISVKSSKTITGDQEERLQKELSLVEEAALQTPRAKQRPWFVENVYRERVKVFG